MAEQRSLYILATTHSTQPTAAAFTSDDGVWWRVDYREYDPYTAERPQPVTYYKLGTHVFATAAEAYDRLIREREEQLTRLQAELDLLRAARAVAG